MKKIIVLTALLFFPLSNVHAFSWTSPLHSELGTPGNPLRVQITNVKDFRPPSYCSYLPSFFARWSQFSACTPVLATRDLQTTLTTISNSLEEQNRIVRDAQIRSLVFPVRPTPIYVAPTPVVKNPAPTNTQPDPVVIQSVIDQVSNAIIPAASNCDANGNCWGSAGGGSAASGGM